MGGLKDAPTQYAALDSPSLRAIDPFFKNGAVQEHMLPGVFPPSNYLLYRIALGAPRFYRSTTALMYKAQESSASAPVAELLDFIYGGWARHLGTMQTPAMMGSGRQGSCTR